jgi:hypothetical protein
MVEPDVVVLWGLPGRGSALTDVITELRRLNEEIDLKMGELDRRMVAIRLDHRDRLIPSTPAQRAALLQLGVGGNLGALTSTQADRLIAELGGDEFSGFETMEDDPAVPIE